MRGGVFWIGWAAGALAWICALAAGSMVDLELSRLVAEPSSTFGRLVSLAGEGRIKKAYTGSFVDSASHDEYGYARSLGEFCGFEVERVMLSNRELSDRLEGFLDSASMPQGDNSGLATYCVARQVARDYRVVLGGDGGDELFGGYPTYTFPFLSQRYGFIPKGAVTAAHRVAARLCDRQKYLSLPFKLQQLSLAWGRQGAEAHFALKDFLPEPLAADEQGMVQHPLQVTGDQVVGRKLLQVAVHGLVNGVDFRFEPGEQIGLVHLVSSLHCF